MKPHPPPLSLTLSAPHSHWSGEKGLLWFLSFRCVSGAVRQIAHMDTLQKQTPVQTMLSSLQHQLLILIALCWCEHEGSLIAQQAVAQIWEPNIAHTIDVIQVQSLGRRCCSATCGTLRLSHSHPARLPPCQTSRALACEHRELRAYLRAKPSALVCDDASKRDPPAHSAFVWHLLVTLAPVPHSLVDMSIVPKARIAIVYHSLWGHVYVVIPRSTAAARSACWPLLRLRRLTQCLCVSFAFKLLVCLCCVFAAPLWPSLLPREWRLAVPK